MTIPAPRTNAAAPADVAEEPFYIPATAFTLPATQRAATLFALLQASLGLEFDPDTKEIKLRNPHLEPGFGACDSALPDRRTNARRDQEALVLFYMHLSQVLNDDIGAALT